MLMDYKQDPEVETCSGKERITSFQTRRDPDTIVKFEDKEHKISAVFFACYSARFSKMLLSHSLKGSSQNQITFELDLEMNGQVAESSVVEFLNACQMKQYVLTVENVHDINLLASVWEADTILSATERFINCDKNKHDLVVPTIQFGLTHNKDTSQYEQTLSETMWEFLDQKGLLELPLAVIQRVFAKRGQPDEKYHEYFKFLVEYINHYEAPSDQDGTDKEPSILFHDMDFYLMNEEEYKALKASKYDWSYNREVGTMVREFVGSYVHQKKQAEQELIAALKAMEEYKKKFEDLTKQHEEEMKKMRASKDGIIRQLSRKYPGNSLHSQGVVYVSCNSCNSGSCEYVVIPGNRCTFRTSSSSSAYIQLDFGNNNSNRRIYPTAYKIRTDGNGPGSYNLKNWAIQVSTDGSNWTEIDRRTNDYGLNGAYASQRYDVSNPGVETRYFKIRNTGCDHSGNHYMTVCSIEIYGELKE